MSENTTEVIVGGAVLAAALGFLFYAGQVTGFATGGSSDNQYSASFRSIQGVSVGTDVRMAGVKVGTVTELVLNPDTFRADAMITVANDVILPDDTAVVVSSEGLLGGNFIELLPGGSITNIEPGAEIEDTQSSVGLVELLLKFVSGSGGE
ncbi:MAG: outer membrane lipid asymmetry maintenance protein MlaD [Marinosulfonomonas sp.]|nr:MAG: outer membrane lipid asymmetry maintenance protein MlaD [Marinosulfonomonas sp.]